MHARYNRHDKAKECFEMALQKDISSDYRTKVYNRLGNIYRRMNDPDKAAEFYLKSVEINPDFFNPLNSLGDIYFKRGEYKSAEYYFKKAAEKWPGSDNVNANLGTTYIMLNDKKNALKYWKRSLEINPNQPQIREYILRNK